MDLQTASIFSFDFVGNRDVVIEPSKGALTSDAGLLPIRQFDETIGYTRAFAAALEDRRGPGIKHSITEMVRSRIYGVIAGYVDQNDHDTVRNDPCFKLIAGRLPDDAPLASQPTLSRFENDVTIKDLKQLREVLVGEFLDSFPTPPERLTFDLDAVDDPAHGAQQLTLFHGFYDQHQYLPLFINCAENDQFVMASLRHGTSSAALGADDDLAYLVTKVRQRWPDITVYVRGDSGFGVPGMYTICERLGLYYTFGFAGNKVLQRDTADLLAEAEKRYKETGEPQRLFRILQYKAKAWPKARWLIVKVECHEGGTNRRFIISNRPGAAVLPDATYDEYVMRGESENRNKEIKCGLAMDRMSDHRFKANYFRLYLHVAAFNLLARLRRKIQQPALSTTAAMSTVAGDLVDPHLPPEALVGSQRQRYFRERRKYDLLGRAQPDTWRVHLIKVAAEIVVTIRRVVIRLASHWPHLDYFLQVSAAVGPLPAS